MERDLVQILSVFGYAPKTDLIRALSSLGHRSAKRVLRNEDVNPSLETLESRGFLSDESSFALKPVFIHSAAISATDRIETLAEIARRIRPRDTEDRELRLALYSGNYAEAERLASPGKLTELNHPFDPEWVGRFPRSLQGRVLLDVLDSSATQLISANKAFEMLEGLGELSDDEHSLYVEQLMLRGRICDARKINASRVSYQAKVNEGWLELLSGRASAAIAAFEAALAGSPKQGRFAHFLPQRAGVFFLLALVARGAPGDFDRAELLVRAAQKGPWATEASTIKELIETLREQHTFELFISQGARLEGPLRIYVNALALAWSDRRTSKEGTSNLLNLALSAEAAGYHWFASELAAILRHFGSKEPQIRGMLVQDANPIVGQLQTPEKWSQVFDALIALTLPKSTKAPANVPKPPEQNQRLIWIAKATYGHVDLRPVEQVRQKGQWSKGRPVALKRLYEDSASMPWLSAADRAAVRTIERNVTIERGRYENVSYRLDDVKSLIALAGEPNVFVEQGGALVPAQTRAGAPRLRLGRASGKNRLVFDPAPRAADELERVTNPAPGVFEIVSFEPRHYAIAQLLGPKGLIVPPAAEGRLPAVLSALSKLVAIETDVVVAESPERTVVADSRPHVLIRPLGAGLSAEIVVRPLGAEGPAVRPGEGGKTLVAQISGQAVSTNRELSKELELARATLAGAPTLAGFQFQAGSWRFSIADTELALEALTELRSIEVGTIEWPEGEILLASHEVGIESLEVKIRGDAEFELGGSLLTPELGALELGTLLDYLEASPGRFLRVQGNDRFFTLTRDLKARLDELRLLRSGPNRIAFHPLAASYVQELVGGAQIEASVAYRQAVQRLVAEDLEELPTTFHAQLRSYQSDGYRWLARLSRFELGGCLADEMGLGKTVQTLALLVLRAPLGPSLVVTPTSIVSQWVDELARFAPTLRARKFTGDRRDAALDDLRPFDVVITSYAILQLEADRLAALSFEVAILDEAQLIKNAQTLRAKAAFRLVAKARFATTGTPIENRLGELHSLFRFLNPGFLGTEKTFEARFAGPIEREKNAQVRDQLRRLISPFVLRRTKSQVLPELPARTEVTLRVDLGIEELALYEALREKTLEGLASDASRNQRILLLAAITRLRRAASNSKMVLPDSTAPSAKLEALEELLDELLEGGHKALIFSQFVDHLSLIRAMIERRGVGYQYLDGATSGARRETAIEEFQAGKSSVFLISLKAGGFGLNLTAADTVIHMDPWWNPATEDQASDRAHRIGQSRPVTIYRIVANGTIEEKILELHHRKRELAASLLESSETAGQLSEVELLDLIKASSKE